MTRETPAMDIHAVLNAVRERWWVILLTALAAAGLAVGGSQLQPERYKASADLLFQQPDPAPTVDPRDQVQDLEEAPERRAATNLALTLASLDKVKAQVRQRINSPHSIDELRERVEAEPQGQADIVSIEATGDTREEAVAIANAFAADVVAVQRLKEQAEFQRVIDSIQAELVATPAGAGTSAGLRERIQDLTAQKRLETGEVEIAQEAVPPRKRSAPKPVRNGVVGGGLGLLLGFLLSLLLHRLDRRIESDEEVPGIVGAPVLARIPVEKDSEWERELFVEAFQFLRSNLQLRDPERRERVLAVTSALPGNGKSTVAARLAEALARGGEKVVAVDADLRRPTLHEQFAVDAGEGVSNAIVGGRDPVELLIPTKVANVRLLPAGPLMPIPASVMVGMPGMDQLVKRLREEADYVIIDTSPLTLGADASAVAALVDATLVVVDVDEVPRDLLEAAMEQLRGARGNVIGVVLNRADVLLGDHAYRGYYGALGVSATKEPAGGDRAANGSSGRRRRKRAKARAD